MTMLTFGSLAPAIISAAPGTLAFVATTAPGTPTFLPGLLSILSALG
ncbi:hypothetical protein [Nioella sp.]|jgi:hypothetical protein